MDLKFFNISEENFFNNLINCVRQEKLLYEKKHPQYSNKHEKNKAWKRISVIVGKPKEECEKRWKLLREKFVRELGKRKTPSGNDESNWPYFDEMLFLKNCITKRRPRGSGISCKDEFSGKEVSTIFVEETRMSDQQSELDERSSINAPSFVSSNHSESKDETINTLKNAHTSSTTKQRIPAVKDVAATSEDELFLKLLLKMMSPLPLSAKDLVKQKIFELIMEQRAQHLHSSH